MTAFDEFFGINGGSVVYLYEIDSIVQSLHGDLYLTIRYGDALQYASGHVRQDNFLGAFGQTADGKPFLTGIGVEMYG